MTQRPVVRILLYAWASPTTLVGLAAGAITLCTRGEAQVRRGVLEFHGGFARWLLERNMVNASAMTLGHVVIGRDRFWLDVCRDHEQVHVRQVERWGGAFIPAYLAASLLAWRRGEHYYLDNWFELDARRRCGEPRPGLSIIDNSSHDQHLDNTTNKATSMPHSSHVHHSPHVEKHFTSSEFVRDMVIGMSDGLTVPFALAAGLTGYADISTRVIVTAGLAEIAAGSIAMGLGGYLAAKSDAEHYESERGREEREVIELPHKEREEVAELFQAYGLQTKEIEPILDAFQANPKAWIDFMMRYELGLEEPDPRRALKSALTIAGAYITGGMIPLAPYMLASSANVAVVFSVILTIIALAIFGYIKGRFTGTRPFRSALQTAVIGGLAASAAFMIARVFS